MTTEDFKNDVNVKEAAAGRIALEYPDAEGLVFLEDGSYRFYASNCKNEHIVKRYSECLDSEALIAWRINETEKPHQVTATVEIVLKCDDEPYDIFAASMMIREQFEETCFLDYKITGISFK
jgi:hypothetical protein